jgi:hypothetical protein
MITIPGMSLYDLLASVTKEHHHLYPFQHGVGGCIAYGLGALYRAWVKSRTTGVIDVCIYTVHIGPSILYMHKRTYSKEVTSFV